MSRFAAFLFLALLLPPGTTWASGPSPEPERLARFQHALQQAATALPDSPGIAVIVQAPRLGLHWRAAVGRADPAGTPLTPEHPIRVASITKGFVGAAVLRLEEDGRLSLAQPIQALVTPATAALLRSGGYDPARITVRQLMDHSSGLRDFYDDPAYEQAVRAEPRRRWTRAEQIAIAMKVGPAHGAPGERFFYGDTGYLILGEIVERATGLPLAAALRELLPYRRLGLAHTWLESLEPAPPGLLPRAHQFADGIDMTTADPSYDLYGGGGLVSTLDDVGRFIRGVLRGEVFRHPATLASGLTLVSARSGEGFMEQARPALFSPDRVGPHACLGLGGYFGTLVVHCPALDLTIGFSANTANPKSFEVASAFMAVVGTTLGTAPASGR